MGGILQRTEKCQPWFLKSDPTGQQVINSGYVLQAETRSKGLCMGYPRMTLLNEIRLSYLLHLWSFILGIL